MLYVGGIMVLFLFVIMLVNLDEAAKERQFNGQWWIALAARGAWSARRSCYFLYKRRRARSSSRRRLAPAPGGLGNTEQHRRRRCSREYLLPFEVASMLLLVAVVGSVVMAKKRI